MVYKIYSPRNRTSDFPTWWQWSKFITIHTVKVSTKMEDNREVRLSVCGGERPKLQREVPQETPIDAAAALFH